MYEIDLLGHAQSYHARAEFLRREKAQIGNLEAGAAARLDRQIAANEQLAAACEKSYAIINEHETAAVAAPVATPPVPVPPKKAP